MKRMICIALIGLLYGLPAQAQPDAAGCKDHPLLNRMPGYFLADCRSSDFDVANFGHGAPNEPKTETVEGKVTYLRYHLSSGAKMASGVQIARNYQNAIKSAGGVTKGDYNGGGCMMSSPTIGGSTGQICGGAYGTSLQLKKNGRDIWIGISVSNQGDPYDVLIAEREAMSQDVVANDLLDKINKEGFISLYINFDTGKATIKPDSFGQLDQVVAALKQAPDLKLEVGGHTDNVGTPASNQTLSDARAKSVMAYLTGKGIAANRLTAKGYGQTSPVADNRSEDGRAKNRRVELVKRTNSSTADPSQVKTKVTWAPGAGKGLSDKEKQAVEKALLEQMGN